VGRPPARRRLEALRGRLAERGVRAEVATDLAALTSCNLILSATNAPAPVILPQHVGDEPVVVCDIATPGDVAPEVRRARPQATILQGGMVRAPGGQAIQIDGFDLAPGELYGCLAETLLLGLCGRLESFSYGSLRVDRILEIRELALRHGFSLVADP
jgi:predicted amino acid dehydrogenase